jgi:hypothetical protein
MISQKGDTPLLGKEKSDEAVNDPRMKPMRKPDEPSEKEEV